MQDLDDVMVVEKDDFDVLFSDHFSYTDDDSDYLTWQDNSPPSSTHRYRSLVVLPHLPLVHLFPLPSGLFHLFRWLHHDHDHLLHHMLPSRFLFHHLRFSLTPPRLESAEQVMNNNPGTSMAALRSLAIALARDAIFGRETMAKCSLSGRKGTGHLDQNKLDYIKELVHLRVPSKTVEFEHNIWTLCRLSISKSCQTIRGNYKRQL